jgi:hypothetical protein
MEEKELKKYAKQIFWDINLLPAGFCIDSITVIFKGSKMIIMDYRATTGKMFGTSHPIPASGIDMLQVLKDNCGVEKVNSQLWSHIRIC